MDEFESTNLDAINSRENKNYFFQIDFLKAVMIFLVIFDHTIPWTIKDNIGVALWERISIPVFLVILGFNMGLAFERKGETSLKKLYSSYFNRKYWRYIQPFIILYLISSIFGLIYYEFNPEAMVTSQLSYLHPDGYIRWRFGKINLMMLILPFWGPGNWFIPVLFSSILIMPILYKGFSSTPFWRIFTLIMCFAIEIAMQLFVYFYFFYQGIDSWDTLFLAWFFICNIFFHLSAVGLGMWFSKNHRILAKQNLFMLILFPLSLFYIIIYQFYDIRFSFIVGDYNYFVYPYSAFLVLFVIMLLPKKSDNRFAGMVSLIGKSTYHILLAQIFYFGIVEALYDNHYCASIIGINLGGGIICFIYLVINWVICIPLGVLWYRFDTKTRKEYLDNQRKKPNK